MVHIVVSPTTMGRRRLLGWAALAIALVGSAMFVRAQSGAPAPAQQPGALTDGTTLLPNGWRLAPAGRHVRVGTLPLNIATSPDGKYAIITNNGVNRPTLSVVNIASWTVRSTTTVDAAWLGLVFSPDGTKLYSSGAGQNNVQEFSFVDGVIARTRAFALPAAPAETFASGLTISRDGRTLYVTRLFAMTLSSIDVASGVVTKTVPLQAEPYTALASADGRFVFVSLWGGSVVEVYAADSLTLVTEMFTAEHPNAMAISPDGKRLFVACGNSASVWVFDTFSNFAIEQISTSLYPEQPPTSTPNSVALSPDGRTLLVANADTNTVAVRMRPVGVPVGSPVPQTVGGSSPIKHVFYVIRENRTYDQVLGDLAEGNGDQRLAIFGRDITPNAHALAQGFVVFDNFYVDADVSYNGHAYSTAAYATDFIEKLWQSNLMGRGVQYLGEGGGFMRNTFGNVSAPMMGYLWDYARRAGVTVRSYGEFVAHTRAANGDISAVESVPGLQGAVAPAYAGWDLDVPDARRVDAWLQEFRQFEANGNLPQLSIIRLPNDHTAGTRAGAPTPRAMMADNDVALGRLVEAISNSAYWRDSAIFVVEDDAQSGPDHVDSHRSILLMASPFARRASADHTFYTTSGVLRTIELILGLPPMSQYDAAATPMYNAFTGTPNLAAFRHVDPLISLNERNLPSSYGSPQSLA